LNSTADCRVSDAITLSQGSVNALIAPPTKIKKLRRPISVFPLILQSSFFLFQGSIMCR
jgi:hypothetical protein